MVKLQNHNLLFDVCFKGQGLAGVFCEVPVTGTLVVKVLRFTEMLALTKYAAATLMSLSRT